MKTNILIASAAATSALILALFSISKNYTRNLMTARQSYFREIHTIMELVKGADLNMQTI